MFKVPTQSNRGGTAFGMLELIYTSVVRDVRKTHRNAFVGLMLNIFQTVVFVLTFYFMFELLGLRGNTVRGDFLLYIMSGIFLYLIHTKAMQSVLQSEGPASPMMNHAPMTTAIAIAAAALSSLYLQLLSLIIVLFVYHVAFTPVVIDNFAGSMAMILAAWFTGVGVGMILLALKPWAPEVVTLLSTIYARANMIASGKMFLANTLPATMLSLFDWNPLFHAIDQARGFVFVNYNPHFSSSTYPFYVGTTLIAIGLMGEFYTRKNASASWGAAR